MTDSFFIGGSSFEGGVDISGCGTFEENSAEINENSVLRSLSQNGSNRKVNVGGENKSYLLSEYQSSPIYVAQLSTVTFKVGDKPYCGNEKFRCETVKYGIYSVHPNVDYTVYVESGDYYEDMIIISSYWNVTVIGKLTTYTILNLNYTENGMNVIKAFVYYSLLHYFLIQVIHFSTFLHQKRF
jgi:hypothetical protein